MSTWNYNGQFYSVEGVKWTFRISHVVDDNSVAVHSKDVAVDFDEPLSIELKATEKYEPIQGSAATVRLISETDREFISLYTLNALDTQLSVYRNGTLYWQGCIDPELYEEPYERDKDYVVTITFSDYAPLEHLKFDMSRTSLITIESMIGRCLNILRSTKPLAPLGFRLYVDTASRVLDLSAIKVRGANFYDEEGQAMSWKEALESVFQPLGLRLIQRQTYHLLYDLRQMRRVAPVQIKWAGDNSRMSVDKVYNDIELTFSPYGDVKAIDGSINHDDIKFDSTAATRAYFAPGYPDNGVNNEDFYNGFNITYGRGAENVADIQLLSSSAGFYKIDSIFSGSDEAGVTTLIKAGGSNSNIFGWHNNPDHRDSDGNRDNLWPCFSVPSIPLNSQSNYKLKVSLDFLFDTRYNPFEDAERSNNKDMFDMQCRRWNFVYIPVRIWVVSPNGYKYYYDNSAIMESNGLGYHQLNTSLAGWKMTTGEVPWGAAWLAYYDWEDRKNKSGCNGWATNRQCIGTYTGEIPAAMQRRGDGEFISAPPGGGEFHIEVGFGAVMYDYNRYVWEGPKVKLTNPPGTIAPRWMLYRNLSVEITDLNGKTQSAKDVVYRCSLNNSAKDPLQLNTTTGTAKNILPTSRGVMMRLDNLPLSEIGRDGGAGDSVRWGRPEELLLSEIASQYEKRSIVLGGLTQIQPNLYPVYSEAAQLSTDRFILTSAYENLREDTSDAVFTQLHPEEIHIIE